MANQYSLQILSDGPRNARIKVDGFLDSTDAVLVPLVSLTDFTNNDQNLLFCGFRVEKIEHTISPNLVISLIWEANTPQSIARLTGYNKLHLKGGIFPNRQALGYTGNILLSTNGFEVSTAQGFTIHMDMVKLYTRGGVISAAA